MGIKRQIHNFTRSLGFDFYALKDKSDGELLRLRWLKEMQIKTVLDIGANEGQFASVMRSLLPGAMIYSFEPIPACFTAMQGKFINDKAFKCFNFAIGDKAEVIDMYVNDFTPSSSLLEIDDLHVENFKHTANASLHPIPVKTLDAVAAELNLEKPYMVKIDTQGYEDKVISGGQHTLAGADVVFLELTYKPLYKGQTLFNDIYTRMQQLGFAYHGNFEELLSPKNGEVLQSDGIFINSRVG